jgi:hypothetical protein
MKSLCILSLLLLSLSSCGKNKLKKEEEPGLAFGRPLSDNRVLKEPERLLGVEACIVLRDKREYFETLEDNKIEFNFKAKEQLCGRAPRSLGDFTARLRVPSRGALNFSSSFTRYIDEVLTDKNGSFSHYCDSLLNGEPTNLILPIGGKRVQLRINKVAGKIKLETAWFYPDDRGVFVSYKIDGALIHTTTSTRHSKFHGLTLTRAVARPCDDGTAKYIEQELMVK